MKKYEILNGYMSNIPQPMETETLMGKIERLRGNFVSLMIRNDNPSEVSKRAAKASNRTFVKLAIHYVILGQQKFTQEQIQSFKEGGWSPNYIKIGKHVRDYDGILKFCAWYNPNKNFKSKIVYVDLNTKEVFTKQKMLECGYLNQSSLNNKWNDYNTLKVNLTSICEI